MAAIVVAAVVALVDVTITGPRVHVRWVEGLGDAARAERQTRYGLSDARPVPGAARTWRYSLDDASGSNIRALLEDSAVDDTAYLDPDRLTPLEGRTVRVAVWYPFNDLFTHPRQLLQLHRSAWLLLAGGVLLWAAGSAGGQRRRAIAIAALMFVGVVALVRPFDPSFVTMGGSADRLSGRSQFEAWFGGRVRYEKHLSQVVLLQVYQRLEVNDAAPERALVVVARGATLWFVVSALAIGYLERWSAVVVRYLGLVLLAPATLLYFGWRELGYLSLSVAVFPLLARGLRDDTWRLEAGSALAGLGAALHGVGLVSLTGAWLAAMAAAGAPIARIGRALRVLAYGTAAYLGWIVIYIVVLQLSIQPDPGPTAVNSWRSLTADIVSEGRVAHAVLSAPGIRDVLMSAWVVGAPLVAVAASLWRRYPHEVRAALCYLPPSALFLVFRWPFEGVGGGMDLVAGGFPAAYALAWVCAQDSRRTGIAAALLASAHYAFWRVVLDERFVP